MKFSFKAILVSIVVLLGMATSARAAQSIPYQGHLTDAGGIDLDAAVPVEVRLYDSLIAGIGQGVTNSHVIYAESHADVNVENGVFRIFIGDGTTLGDAWDDAKLNEIIQKEAIYLELWIDGDRLSPRQRMGSMPTVFNAKYAKHADHVVNIPTISPDDVPNYDAGMIAHGTIAPDRIPSGLSVSLIEGTFNEECMPTLTVDKFEQLGYLPTELITQLDASKISGGMVDIARFPETRYVSKDDLVILSGSTGDGQQIASPSGMANTNCITMLTPSVTLGSVEGIDQIILSLDDNTNVVTCKIDWYNENDDNTYLVPCTANYMLICRAGYENTSGTLVKIQ